LQGNEVFVNTIFHSERIELWARLDSIRENPKHVPITTKENGSLYIYIKFIVRGAIPKGILVGGQI
jgi:hypothetical protein